MKAKLKLFFILFLLSGLLFGCKKNTDVTSNNNNNSNNSTNQSIRAYKSIQSGDTIIMGNNVVFVKSDINNNLQQVNPDNLVFSATGFQDTIKVGDILYSNSNTNGYARKIISKSIINGLVTFSTQEAAITDVYVQLNETSFYSPVLQQDKLIFYNVDSFLYNNMDTLPPTYRTNSLNIPGAITTITANQLSVKGINLTSKISALDPRIPSLTISGNNVSFDYILFDADNNYLTKNDQLIISVSFTKSNDSYINPYTRNGILYVDGAYYFDTKVILSKKYSANFSAIDNFLRANLLNKRLPIVKIPLTGISPTNFVIEPTLDIFILLSLDLNGQLEVTANVNHAGVKFNTYFNSFTFGNSLNANFDQSSMTKDYTVNAEVSGTAKAGIGAGFTLGIPNFPYNNGLSAYIGIYGAVSLNGNISANATSTSPTNACYNLDLNSSVVGDIWVQANFKLKSYEFNATRNILNNNTISTLAGKKYSYCTGNEALPAWAQVPILTTTKVTGTTSTSAVSGGNITSNGGSSVTTRGVCWSTSNNPTITNSITTNGSGIGNYTSNLTNLAANTTYYVRAYATNSNGTGYGNSISFLTTAATLPIINTNSPLNITVNSATSGGNISSDGGAMITARGVCFSSTNQIPTLNDSKTSDGTNTGNFNSSLNGLTPNTTYYVRAYATNTAGTSYGSTVTFTTTQQNISTVWNQVTLSSFAFAIKTEGTLWGWGLNTTGQLGDGTTTNRNTLTQNGSGTNWIQVACGNTHTVALKADGTLWAWGSNIKGELGDGTTTNRNTPAQVGTASNWKQVACGNSFTLAIKTDGTLWAWGMNTYGELGDGTTNTRYTPVQVGTASNWKQVACGRSEYTLAIKTDGTLWGWGLDGYIGNGTRSTFFTTPIQIGTNNTWNQVVCGNSSTLSLRADGTLWSWGYNGVGQLGDGTTTDRWAPVQIGTANNWKQIACGYNDGNSVDHSAAIKVDGTLWAWGYNNGGQLGDGTTTNRSTPIQIGTDNQWKQVACGWSATAAIKTDGTLWEWGIDVYQNINSKVPLQIK